ncbi:MAG: sulfatase [Planctomycetes bacterium]|nr:sulfatase [Planctomycetota bacterium]
MRIVPSRRQRLWRKRLPAAALAVVWLFGPWLAAELGAADRAKGVPQKPNFVFLLVDDLGWADLGCYGADLHETPNIDRLAASGMRFTNAYAAAPVCSPTRASILTGKSPARLHMTIWRESSKNRVFNRKLLPPDTVADLPHEEVTIAEALQAAGYVSAHVGKWHLGDFTHYPQTMGFPIAIGGTGWGAPQTFWWPYSGRGRFGNEFRYVPHLEWGKPGEYLTDRLTTEAIHVIERLKDRPFFLYMCWHTVHTPIEGKPELVEKHRRRLKPEFHHQNVEYAAMVESLDQNVGRILAKLDELGLARNTVVFLTSDNGGYINRFRNRQVTSNAPLRSGKGSLYEGGVRVPLIVRWPKHVPAGSVCRTPVISDDFYPTILQLAGIEGDPKHNATVDGKSLAPVLRNPQVRLDRDTLYWHYPHYYPTTSPVSAIRQGDWKLLHYYEDDRIELYNLAEDLGERTNLADKKPDVAQRLKQQLAAWLNSVEAQFPRPNPRGGGRTRN